MSRTRTFVLGLAAVAVAALTLAPASASAQVETHRGDYRGPLPNRGRDWDWDGDRDRNRPWRIEDQVDLAERRSNAFRHWYERIYAREHFHRDGDARDFKRDIQRMDEAMERLKGRADDHRPGRGREEMQDALRWGREIDGEINRDRDTRFTYREWNDLRETLNGLARIYRLRGI